MLPEEHVPLPQASGPQNPSASQTNLLKECAKDF